MRNLSEAWELYKKLFSIYRTLMGSGYNSSLEEISAFVPLTNKFTVASGTSCGSWVVPDEWTVKEAYISDMDGNKIIDYNNSGFHIWQYSISTNEIINHNDLMSRLAVGKGNCIPQVVTYYKKRWGFSVSSNQLGLFNQQQYRIYVDSEFAPGKLTIGEIFIKGESDDIVIIDSVLSCNRLANNLSGVIAAAYLASQIMDMENLHYSYRVLFTPETIGPIALHYHFPHIYHKAIGGINLINLADKAPLQYKWSRKGTSVDQAVEYTLGLNYPKARVCAYDVMTGTCGNEKAYNSLGINVPIGALRRSELCSYPEYDTSEDNFEFISKESFFTAMDLLHQMIFNIETNLVYEHTFQGEPFLTGYGLFPKIEKDVDRIPYDYLMGFTDGAKTLIDIAMKSKQPLSSFHEPVRLMKEKGLIKIKQS